VSKRQARNAESYETETRLFRKTVELVEANGFQNVRQRNFGSAKFIDADTLDGNRVTFWLKLGWSGVPFAAIQFGMFVGAEGSLRSDQDFVDSVIEKTRRMKERGTTHALLAHRGEFAFAVPIDELGAAYEEQMRRFPKVARNTKSPTMWFFDPRTNGNEEVARIVRKRAIPLAALAQHSEIKPEDPQAQSRMAEVELRIMQQTFRVRVGERCGWRCTVTGSTLREMLDAAHLPGRDWRKHNDGTDGILLRADIHRLLDRGLASIAGGIFNVSDAAKDEYGRYDGIAMNSKECASTPAD
jgi:hypothetical protein